MKLPLRITTSLLLLFSVCLPSKAINPDSFVLPTSNLRIAEISEAQLLVRRVPRLPIQPNRLSAALSRFRQRTVRVGSTEFSLGTNDMRHILERHHPRFWNGSTRTRNTSFRENMTINEVTNAVLEVANQNRQTLSRLGRGTGQVRGVFNGVRYVLGVRRGRFHQFYPE